MDYIDDRFSQESGLEDLSLRETIDIVLEERLNDLHTSMPARVEAYDASKQVVTVTPMISRHLPDGKDGYVAEALPKLANIPVEFLRSGSWFFAPPIAPGDFGRLVFCERNIGSWRATGSPGDPGDIRTHTLDGAVFVPGIAPDRLALTQPDGTLMRIGHDSGEPLIEMDSSAKLVRVVPTLRVRHIESEPFGVIPISASSNLTIDPSSTDESGWFTLSGLAAPATDKQIGGIKVTYIRPYANGSRVEIFPANDDAAKIMCPNIAAPNNVLMSVVVVYASASDATSFTVDNRAGSGGSTNPALNGTKWGYRVVGF